MSSFVLEAPPWLSHSTAVVFGLISGSFANVLVARLPHDESIVKPGSRCPHCKEPIRKRDNIPLVGYLLLKGRCRGCRQPISPRYPVIEALCALLFLAAELKSGGLTPALVLRDWPFLMALLAITFIDLEHRIIPDELSLGGLGWGLATCWFARDLPWLQAVIGAAIGFGVFYSMAFLYSRVANRQGLGGGDVKLLAMMGAFLGPLGVMTTIVVSSLLGSAVGIGWGIWLKQKDSKADMMKLAIPYGPFLVIGGLYYYFFREWIWLQFTIPT